MTGQLAKLALLTQQAIQLGFGRPFLEVEKGRVVWVGMELKERVEG